MNYGGLKLVLRQQPHPKCITVIESVKACSGIDIPSKPNNAIEKIPGAESLKEMLPDTVVWNQWIIG